jgi:hypothetical protein
MMAALGASGITGERWADEPDPAVREAEALEMVKIALQHGVDINAVNRFDRTCKVPWDVPNGQVRECIEVDKPDQDLHGKFAPPRTALEAARSMGYRTVASFLLEKGGIGDDVPVTGPKTVHH